MTSSRGGQELGTDVKLPWSEYGGLNTDPVYMSRKIRKFRTDKFDT